jgi:16S rRNA (cytidine1402-2'-O)-methyltransferase
VPLAVCATPIGNLDDITLRVLEELRAADVVLAEDTRHTRGLLERYEIKAKLVSYHEHNEASRVEELVPRLVAGERMALVSDAGMPLVSDPGARLVRAALDAGVQVTVLPGASAVETALVASGLGGGPYAFVGFLPRKAGELETLWREAAAWGCAVVAFESPQRVGASLRSLATIDPAREVAVCRELTKRFEEVVRGPAASWPSASPTRRRARSWSSSRPDRPWPTWTPRSPRSRSSSRRERRAASPRRWSRG